MNRRRLFQSGLAALMAAAMPWRRKPPAVLAEWTPADLKHPRFFWWTAERPGECMRNGHWEPMWIEGAERVPGGLRFGDRP